MLLKKVGHWPRVGDTFVVGIVELGGFHVVVLTMKRFETIFFN